LPASFKKVQHAHALQQHGKQLAGLVLKQARAQEIVPQNPHIPLLPLHAIKTVTPELAVVPPAPGQPLPVQNELQN
jgi:hypothetical protein